jgi:23S rRNA pseudouridine1911/1915/1917 synthase
MTNEAHLRVVADQVGERLDVAVARLCDVSRALAHRLISEGLVSEAGRQRRKPGDKLAGGETLDVIVPAPEPAEPQPEAIDLDIVFEDDEMLIVNKPPGMAVHPGPGHTGKTLVNALLAHCPDLPGINGVQRPGIVHRLDKDTSGLIAVAKTERAQRSLSQQLKQRETKKTYLALVEGRVEPSEAMIDAPLGRDPRNRLRMMVLLSGGREAQTSYRVREVIDGLTLVEASPITGRTHQIRVHLASIGHPVVGDLVYGHRSKLVDRQFLHAWRLTLHHPVDGRELRFEAPLAPDLQRALDALHAGATTV